LRLNPANSSAGSPSDQVIGTTTLTQC
jgi:hypothetical protein